MYTESMYTDIRCMICLKLLFLAGLVGCSGKPSRVDVPDFNPDEIGAQAIEQYDKDGDGKLSVEECQVVKSLGEALSRLDADGDGNLSSAEIAARIAFYHDFKAALVPAYCTVKQKGRPVADAKVTYEPEDFMGPYAIPAYGLTGSGGSTMISIDEEHRQSPAHRGAQPGFYRIRITLANGNEVTDLNAGTECSGDLMNNYTVVLP